MTSDANIRNPKEDLHDLVDEIELWRVKFSRLRRRLKERTPTEFFLDSVSTTADALSSSCKRLEDDMDANGPKPPPPQSSH